MTTPEANREDHPGQLQPGIDVGQGVAGEKAEKTTRRGTPRLSQEERGKINGSNSRKHGLSRHPLYEIWRGVRARVGSRASYVNNHIYLASEWQAVQDFVRGVESEIGPRPGKPWSLDRIDNDRGYEPGNVRWATASTQAANRGHEPLPICLLEQRVEPPFRGCWANPCIECPWPDWS